MTNEKKAEGQKLPAVGLRPDGCAVIRLAYPVEWGSEKVSELTLRRPKGQELRGLKGEGGADEAMRFAAKLTEHPDSLFDELDVVDLAAVLEAVDGFLPQSLKTGGNGSGT